WERLTVQLPLAANDTGRPEEAEAETAKSGSPNVLFASAPKEIVWLALSIASLRDSPAAIALTPLAAAAGTLHCPQSVEKAKPGRETKPQPQATTLPSLLRARACQVPAAIAVTPLAAAAGTVHCPASLPPPQPQATTLPSSFKG